MGIETSHSNRRRFGHLVDLVIFEVRKLYVGSALGLVWAIIEPLSFLGTYFFLFAFVLDVAYTGPGGRLGYLVFLFSGLAPWLFFNNCVARGSSILQAHAPLVKQINFPVDLLPFIVVSQIGVEFTINLALLTLLSLALGLISPSCLLLLPAVVVLAIFCISIAHILSCYAILFPDLTKIVPTILRIGIFVSPVLYAPSAMPGGMKIVAIINPISYLIVPFRYAFLPGEDVFVFDILTDMAIAIAITLTVAFIAYRHRNFVRETIVDYL